MEWTLPKLVSTHLLHLDSTLTGFRPARVLRPLATQHIFRELSPNVFAHNRISTLIDTGKSFEAIQAACVGILKTADRPTDCLHADPKTSTTAQKVMPRSSSSSELTHPV